MNTPEYTIQQLPEFPLEAFELGGKLDHAGTEPVLTIKPQKAPLPDKPSPPAAATSKRSESFARKYLTQVTYPRVNCYPPNDLFEQTLQLGFPKHPKPLKENEADPEAIARHEQFYKLTSHKGVKLSSPYFCRVRYGPWSAIVFEEGSCFQGVPNKWELFIVEIPEVALTWYGAWEDIPPFPSLHVFMGLLHKIDETRFCCPGYVWCATTNSCIPATVKCGNPVPV